MKKYILLFIFLAHFSTSPCMDKQHDQKPHRKHPKKAPISFLFLSFPLKPFAQLFTPVPDRTQTQHLTQYSGPILRQTQRFQKPVNANGEKSVIFDESPRDPELYHAAEILLTFKPI